MVHTRLCISICKKADQHIIHTMQVEGDAKMLRKTTEQLAERTEALKKELAAQKEDFSQKLFEAQQENNQVRCHC